MEPSIWSEPVVTDLRVFAELQLSASKIASRLAHKHGVSVTRSAVIGKCNRAGINLNGANGQRLHPLERRERKKLSDQERRTAMRLRKKADREATTVKIATAPPIEDIAISIGQRKTFLQLRDCDCRWPVGEPGTKDFFFCGGAALNGLPYCAYHWRVGHTRALPAKKEFDTRTYGLMKSCHPTRCALEVSKDREDGAGA